MDTGKRHNGGSNDWNAVLIGIWLDRCSPDTGKKPGLQTGFCADVLCVVLVA